MTGFKLQTFGIRKQPLCHLSHDHCLLRQFLPDQSRYLLVGDVSAKNCQGDSKLIKSLPQIVPHFNVFQEKPKGVLQKPAHRI